MRHKHITAITLCLAATLLAAGLAQATPWTYPDEVSVAEVYNTLYGTGYDTASHEGLDALRLDHGTDMASVWNTSVFPALQVMVFDTGSTSPLALRYGEGFAQSLTLFDPGDWTAPSRGYLPGGGPIIDLAGAIGQGRDFQFLVGNTVLSAANSIAFLGLDGATLVGYNGGGFSGDADFNEPLFRSATPIPGSMIILGAGLLGLVGLQRFRRSTF